MVAGPAPTRRSLLSMYQEYGLLGEAPGDDQGGGNSPPPTQSPSTKQEQEFSPAPERPAGTKITPELEEKPTSAFSALEPVTRGSYSIYAPAYREEKTAAGRHIIATESIKGGGLMMTPEEHEESFDSWAFEGIDGVFESFAAPGQGLLYGIYKAGEELNWAEDTIKGKALRGVSDVVYRGLGVGMSGDDAQDEERDRLAGEMADHLVNAFDSGALATRARLKRSEQSIQSFMGTGEAVPKADGVDLFDAAFPPQLAEKLIELEREAGNTARADYLEWASSPVGREVIGIGIEMVFDPLNLAGPAKGASVVARGDKLYTISKSLSKAATAAATGIDDLPVEAARLLVLDAAIGDEASKARALTRLEEAGVALQDKAAKSLAQAKTYRQMADDPEQAREAALALAREKEKEMRAIVKGQEGVASPGQLRALSAQVDKATKEAMSLSNPERARELLLRRAASEEKKAKVLAFKRNQLARSLDTSKLNKQVVKKGAFSVHIPLTQKMGYALPNGIPLVREIPTWVRKTSPNIERIRELRRSPMGMDQLTPGEKLLAVADSIGAPIINASMRSWDLLAQAVGTRHIQPLLAKGRIAALADAAGAGSSASKVLARVPEETWANAQNAITKMMAKVSNLDQQLDSKMAHLVRTANRAAKEVSSKSGVDVSPAEIIAEASNAIESGAGMLSRGEMAPILRPLAAQIDTIIDDIVETYGEDIENVRQAVVALSRGQVAGDAAQRAQDLKAAIRIQEDLRVAAKTPGVEAPPGTLARAQALGKIKKRLEKTKPRLKVPDLRNADDYTVDRVLKQWEEDLWLRIEDLTGHLDTETRMLAAFTALRNSPKIPNEAQWDKWIDEYGSAIGRRMGDIDESVMPVVEIYRGIIASYEELFEKHGFRFMKTPESRLVHWGVVGYVPHPEAEASEIINARSILRGGEDNPYATAISDIDNRFSTGMDARKRRSLGGTVQEINAMAARWGEDAVTITTDPHRVMARYLQANRALSAQDFLVMLHEGGVMRRFPTPRAALDEDYVPLFNRSRELRGEDFLFGGREAWDRVGNTEADLRALRSQWMLGKGTGDKAEEMTPLASWVQSSPQLREARNVEDAIFLNRLSAKRAGADFIDWKAEALKLIDAGEDPVDAWQTVADRMTGFARLEYKDFEVPVSGPALQRYFMQDTPTSQLYLPAAVVQNIDDVFNLPKLSAPARKIRDLQNMWKERVTIPSITFTVRNAVSNYMTQVLDIGFMGAFNPVTNIQAARLSTAAIIADRWGGGSYSEAMKNLRGRRLSEKEARELDAVVGGADQLDELRMVDLGDGIDRDIDEALNLMRQHGVLSGSTSQYVDIAVVERGLSEALMTNSADVAKRWASHFEDAVFVLAPMAVGGVPLGLPKTWGSTLARGVENHARILNFTANMRRSGGDIAQSAEHVNKFLFNYDDLTAMQKTYARLAIPFFTWSMKNVQLQLDMMKKSPSLYSNFNRIFLEDGARAVHRIDDPNAKDPNTPEARAGRWSHTLSQIRIKIPGTENQYLEGFGTPLEAFAEHVSATAGMIRSLKNMNLYNKENNFRLLGQVNFVAKIALELVMKRSLFYDKPIAEMTNPKLMMAWIDAVTLAGKLPLIGPQLKEMLVEESRMHAVAGKLPVTSRQGVVWALGHIPHSRVIRDAMAMSEQSYWHATTPASGELDKAMTEMSYMLRLLDAYSGIRTTVDNPEWAMRANERKPEESMEYEQELMGATKSFSNRYIPKD